MLNSDGIVIVVGGREQCNSVHRLWVFVGVVEAFIRAASSQV